MKKLLIVLMVLLPVFMYAQVNKVVTTDGVEYVGSGLSIRKNNLVFYRKATPRMNKQELKNVQGVYGSVGNVSKNRLSKYPHITLYPDWEQNMKAEVKQLKSQGFYLKRAGNMYLTSMSLTVVGTGLFVLGASADEPVPVYVAGGVVMVGGLVCVIAGHLNLIKAGKAYDAERANLTPSDKGVGLSLNF